MKLKAAQVHISYIYEIIHIYQLSILSWCNLFKFWFDLFNALIVPSNQCSWVDIKPITNPVHQSHTAIPCDIRGLSWICVYVTNS
jgi:hypothetical protein